MSGTGQKFNLISLPTPDIKVSFFNQDNANRELGFPSAGENSILDKVSSNSESQVNKLNIRDIKQAKEIAERQFNQPTVRPKSNQIKTNPFEYSLSSENQTLEAEIAQNIHQKLLDQINQIIYSNSLRKEEKELQINQLVLGLISGITNLSVINSEYLTPVMLSGLPSKLISEFLTHSKSSEFIQKVAFELETKLEYITLYLQRF
jgi:hypothetical protein